MIRPRTYWHLQDQRRKPSEYELTTTRLLYHVDRGLAVHTPIEAWFQRYRDGSPLRCADWDGFRDPRETTYSSYVALQRDQETFVDGLLAGADAGADDRAASPDWLRVVDQVVGPLRYPVHGLQMIAAYVGSMAPGGRVAVACALQAADELRRVQRLAYRLRQVQERDPGVGADSLDTWQRAPAWQPWRRVIEHLLVTYDWGEALVALAVVVKPSFDALFGDQLAARARAAGDDVLAWTLRSLGADAAWHQAWTAALLRPLALDPSNRAAMTTWVARWRGEVAAAVESSARLLDDSTGPEIVAAVGRAAATATTAVGLAPGATP